MIETTKIFRISFPQVGKNKTYSFNLVNLMMALLRIRVNFKTFTPSNTGLEKASQYPELGSAFKAAFMKAACWFFTKMSVELAEANPDES